MTREQAKEILPIIQTIVTIIILFNCCANENNKEFGNTKDSLDYYKYRENVSYLYNLNVGDKFKLGKMSFFRNIKRYNNETYLELKINIRESNLLFTKYQVYTIREVGTGINSQTRYYNYGFITTDKKGYVTAIWWGY